MYYVIMVDLESSSGLQPREHQATAGNVRKGGRRVRGSDISGEDQEGREAGVCNEVMYE